MTTDRGEDPVVVWAPAKLTLELRVTGMRTDGYHLLDAEMITLSLADRLEIDPSGDGLTVTGAGPDVTAGPENLVNRALVAAGRRAGVRLGKQIPSGAGLGGGSADAGAVLRWAGRKDPELAARLGADVPFCTVGGRARVRGIGEDIEPLPFAPLLGRCWTLVTPPVHVPTPAVYRAWDDLGGPTAKGPNDLEPAALAVAPELARTRDALGDSTGVTPVLAGSGSTWFVEGAFPAAGRTVVHAVPAGWDGPYGTAATH